MPAKTKSTRKAKPAARPSVSARSRASAPAKRSASAKPAGPAKIAKAAKETAHTVRRSSAELHFTETTIIRGEAVEPGEAMPSGATHEIAGHDASGQPILKRKRFSIC